MKKSLFALAGVIVALVCFILAQNFGLIPVFRGSDSAVQNPINLNATYVQFSAWELDVWGSVKNRLVVYNVDPEFTGNRVLQWISMRNSTSASWDNYYQKSMEWLCFGKDKAPMASGKLL